MTIFIYEHLTSGALLGQSVSPSLLHEGESMLTAICGDLLDLGYDVSIIRDSRLPSCRHTDKLTVYKVNTAEQFELKWTQCQADYHQFIIIAPETDQCLYQLTKTLEEKNKQVLGCDSGSIALCSDKLSTFIKLKSHQFKTPETYLASQWLNDKADIEKWVIKPIDGAGTEQTYVFSTKELNGHLVRLTEPDKDSFIIQPYVQGESLSLNLFIDHDNAHILSINKQLMALNHKLLNWQGCISSYKTSLTLEEQFKAIVAQLIDAIPGLWGFIGIDFILNGQSLYIIDINPRLTTCYSEIGSRISKNPAAHLHNYLNKYKHDRN